MFVDMGGFTSEEEALAYAKVVAARIEQRMEPLLRNADAADRTVINALVGLARLGEHPSYDTRMAMYQAITNMLMNAIELLRPGRGPYWEATMRDVLAASRELEGELRGEAAARGSAGQTKH